MYAAEHGNDEMAKLLMDHNANVNAQSSLSQTALTLAAKFGNDAIVKLLHHPELDVDQLGFPALNEAVRNGHIEVVQELLMHLAVLQRISNRDVSGTTVFDIAKRSRNEKMMQLLTEANAKHSDPIPARNETAKCGFQTPGWVTSPKTVSEEIRSLLWEAVREGQLAEIITILTNHLESIEIGDEFGDTPLLLAAIHSQVHVVRLLLLLQAKANATDTNGESSLMIAARHGRSIDLVRSLLDDGAKVNATREDRWTALMLASKGGLLDIVQLLLESGACVNARSKHAMTALFVAVQCGHDSIVDALLTEGAAQYTHGMSSLDLKAHQCNQSGTVPLLSSPALANNYGSIACTDADY